MTVETLAPRTSGLEECGIENVNQVCRMLSTPLLHEEAIRRRDARRGGPRRADRQLTCDHGWSPLCAPRS